MNRARARMHPLPKILISIVAVHASISFSCTAQSKPDIKQEATTATCGNIVVIGGVATFKCTGLTADQAKLLHDIPAMLTKILKQTQDLSAINRLINTTVQFHYKFDSTQFDTSDKKTLTLFEGAWPSNNMAKELRVIRAVSLVRGDLGNQNTSNQADQSVWSKFAEFVTSNRSKAIASDIGIGEIHEVSDSSIQLSRRDIDDMKHFRLRIYILSAAWWKNVSGSRDSTGECVFLGSDISPDDDPHNIKSVPPTHICPSSVDNF